MNNTSNIPQPFAFGDILFRTTGTAENPLFCVADLCKALGIHDPFTAARGLPDDEKGTQTLRTLGGEQQMLFVTEPGLYRLIFRSTKPEAEQFRKWVFAEVLPAIRKTGRFSIQNDNQFLKQSFEQAKTGKVQLAILGALGIIKPAVADIISPGPVTRFNDAPATTPEDWWNAVKTTFEGQTSFLTQYFRLIRGREKLRLAFHPEPVLTEVRKKVAIYQEYRTEDLRAILQSSPEWIAGSHKIRIGLPGQLMTRCVWAFEIALVGESALHEVCGLFGAPHKNWN